MMSWRPLFAAWGVSHGLVTRNCGFLQGTLYRDYTEGFRPPTFSKIEVSHLAPVVRGYTLSGFAVGSTLLSGSVALLPRGFFNWKVGSGSKLIVCVILFLCR